MPDAPEYQRALDAAEAAAGRGEMGAAADALRRAAELQTAALGPLHPHLAETLNNLGVVAERLEWFDVAEASYRRATAIVEASLPASHPSVETSRRNLREFCEARGIPVAPALPKAEPVAVEPAPPPKTASPEVVVLQAPAPPSAPLVETRPAQVDVEIRPIRLDTIAAPLVTAPRSRSRVPIVAGLIVIALIATWYFARLNDSVEPVASSPPAPVPVSAAAPEPVSAVPPTPVSESPAAPPPAEPPAPPPAEPPAPRPSTSRPSKSPVYVATAPANPTPAAASVSAPPPASAKRPVPEPFPRASVPSTRAADGGVSVVDGLLCRTLDTRPREWACAPVANPASSGMTYFLTRIVTPHDLSAEHRWYRGETLVRTKKISVPASGAPGYRAYSQQVVDARGGGDWRVDFVTRDGRVLQSVRFAVR